MAGVHTLTFNCAEAASLHRVHAKRRAGAEDSGDIAVSHFNGGIVADNGGGAGLAHCVSAERGTRQASSSAKGWCQQRGGFGCGVCLQTNRQRRRCAAIRCMRRPGSLTVLAAVLVAVALVVPLLHLSVHVLLACACLWWLPVLFVGGHTKRCHIRQLQRTAATPAPAFHTCAHARGAQSLVACPASSSALAGSKHQVHSPWATVANSTHASRNTAAAFMVAYLGGSGWLVGGGGWRQSVDGRG